MERRTTPKGASWRGIRSSLKKQFVDLKSNLLPLGREKALGRRFCSYLTFLRQAYDRDFAPECFDAQTLYVPIQAEAFHGNNENVAALAIAWFCFRGA
jgi:hypothetical protein